MNPVGDLAGQPKGEAVDHEEEKTKGKNRNREGQKGEDRAHDRVDDRQNNPKHDRVKIIFDNQPWQVMGANKGNNRRNDDADDK